MTALDNRAGWWSRAACSTADPELFFPISSSGPSSRQVLRAKSVCSNCQIQQACLDYALGSASVQGIWGGTTEAERRRLRHRQARAGARLAQEQAAAPVLVPQTR
jgi:WhiB family transcriptional regulator, redox-sensing transcriptional regulator